MADRIVTNLWLDTTPDREAIRLHVKSRPADPDAPLHPSTSDSDTTQAFLLQPHQALEYVRALARWVEADAGRRRYNRGSQSSF